MDAAAGGRAWVVISRPAPRDRGVLGRPQRGTRGHRSFPDRRSTFFCRVSAGFEMGRRLLAAVTLTRFLAAVCHWSLVDQCRC
ncbi:hypothetical protein MTO96_020623 [Rhipicephalus appendiculatus]